MKAQAAMQTVAEPFLSLLAQTGIETTPRLYLGGDSISGTVRRFQSEAVFTGQRAMAIKSPPTSGYWSML